MLEVRIFFCFSLVFSWLIAFNKCRLHNSNPSILTHVLFFGVVTFFNTKLCQREIENAWKFQVNTTNDVKWVRMSARSVRILMCLYLSSLEKTLMPRTITKTNGAPNHTLEHVNSGFHWNTMNLFGCCGCCCCHYLENKFDILANNSLRELMNWCDVPFAWFVQFMIVRTENGNWLDRLLTMAFNEAFIRWFVLSFFCETRFAFVRFYHNFRVVFRLKCACNRRVVILVLFLLSQLKLSIKILDWFLTLSVCLFHLSPYLDSSLHVYKLAMHVWSSTKINVLQKSHISTRWFGCFVSFHLKKSFEK